MSEREGTPEDFAALFGASAPEPEPSREELEEVDHHAQVETDEPVVEEQPAGSERRTVHRTTVPT